MTEDQFEQLLQDSTQQLRDKQARLERDCHLQAMARWQLNEADAELTFFDAAGVAQLVFSVTPLGSFAAAQDSWKWAWANPKLNGNFRQRAVPLQGLFQITDYDLFLEKDTVSVDAGMAWELAAVAVAHLEALGCYRVTHGDVWLFLALDAVRPAGEV